MRTSARPTGSSAEVGSSRIDQPRRAEQRDRQSEPLLHALREAADGIVRAVGQVDLGERRVDRGGAPTGAAAPPTDAQARVQLEHLASPQPRLVAEQLRQVADAAHGRARSPSGAPSTVPPPPVARASPSSSLTAVVLPAPFGPRKPKISPGSTRRVRSISASVRP